MKNMYFTLAIGSLGSLCLARYAPAQNTQNTSGPIVQQAYLKASNTGISNYFGRSVAISGDTVVVGANGEASNATGVNGNQNNTQARVSDAAYDLVRHRTAWSQQAYF